MIYWISYTIVTDTFKTGQPSFQSLLSSTCKLSAASAKTIRDAQCNQGGRNWADYRKVPESPKKLWWLLNFRESNRTSEQGFIYLFY